MSGELAELTPPPADTMEDRVLRRAGGRWRVERELPGEEETELRRTLAPA